MPRKKTVKTENSLWKADSGWSPKEEDIQVILDRLKFTGQEGIFYLDESLFEQIKREYKEKYDDPDDSVDFRYYTLLRYLRSIFKENFIEFAKFLSKPDRFYDFYYSIDEFFKTGKLSDTFYASTSNGGYFKYSENAQIQIVEVPRGIGKTTVWSCMRAIWRHIRNPEYKWLIASGDKEKAVLLLKSIQEMILNPYLVMIFPDLFNEDPAIFKSRRGNTIVKDKINIMSYDADTENLLNSNIQSSFRKEATFMICSPGIDRTSLHFEGMIADDLVTDITSETPEKTRALKSYFESLFALQEYHKDWRFICDMTGTEWWENSLYNQLENRSNVSIFRAPAKWFYEQRDIRLCDLMTDQFLEDQRQNTGDWFESQYMMKARKYEGQDLDLGYSELNDVTMTLEELEELKKESLVVQVCDPSFMTEGKKEGDKKSRFTILNACVTNDNYYIYSGFQCFGKKVSGIKDTNIEIGLKEKIDFFIQDAQGIQRAFFDEQEIMMKDKIEGLQCKPHTLRQSGGKAAVANRVLRELFLTGDIKIVKIEDDNDLDRLKFMDILKKEIKGVGGMDIVDCIVYMVGDIDRLFDVNVGVMRKRSRNSDGECEILYLTDRGPFKRLA